MKILAVDHGMKNIGIAICDELMISARGLTIISHTNREKDVSEIVRIALENQAGMIIVGISYDEDGKPNEAGKRAMNLIEGLKEKINIDIISWDESLTTEDAKQLKFDQGASRKQRKGHHDALAAAVLLQGYIDQAGRQ